VCPGACRESTYQLVESQWLFGLSRWNAHAPQRRAESGLIVPSGGSLRHTTLIAQSGPRRVYNIFPGFQRDGVWEAIWADLHADLREAMGREASPTAAALDSQSLKSAEKGAAMIAA